MSTFAVVLIALAVLMALLFAGGLIAAGRRAKASEPALRARIEAANEQLAAAHAEDKGWAKETLDAAARDAYLAAHPGAAIDELHLIQVVDNPGTDADEAVFMVLAGGSETTLTLGRSDGAWAAR